MHVLQLRVGHAVQAIELSEHHGKAISHEGRTKWVVGGGGGGVKRASRKAHWGFEGSAHWLARPWYGTAEWVCGTGVEGEPPRAPVYIILAQNYSTPRSCSNQTPHACAVYDWLRLLGAGSARRAVHAFIAFSVQPTVELRSLQAGQPCGPGGPRPFWGSRAPGSERPATRYRYQLQTAASQQQREAAASSREAP